eukprot:TRINITY_DN15606_c0_g1_i1.p1 TRINITY_DN15606_c0_g1~~TRINITY_DN15606_c0_g1_i1.p1  ORF type:complete len:339 (-),score=43.83 TRINITY_DN15606_c0_g1_i1:359-1354(-)
MAPHACRCRGKCTCRCHGKESRDTNIALGSGPVDYQSASHAAHAGSPGMPAQSMRPKENKWQAGTDGNHFETTSRQLMSAPQGAERAVQKIAQGTLGRQTPQPFKAEDFYRTTASEMYRPHTSEGLRYASSKARSTIQIGLADAPSQFQTTSRAMFAAPASPDRRRPIRHEDNLRSEDAGVFGGYLSESRSAYKPSTESPAKTTSLRSLHPTTIQLANGPLVFDDHTTAGSTYRDPGRVERQVAVRARPQSRLISGDEKPSYMTQSHAAHDGAPGRPATPKTPGHRDNPLKTGAPSEFLTTNRAHYPGGATCHHCCDCCDRDAISVSSEAN